MQKLPTKPLNNQHNIHLKMIAESQKQQSKPRKQSGTRLINESKPVNKKIIKNQQPQQDSSFLKFQTKRNSKPIQKGIHRTEIDFPQHNELSKKKTMGIDIEELLKVEEYNSSQSPQHNDLYTMLRKDTETMEDENQEVDQEIKIPAFFGRASLDPKEKNQFYMTQVLNQSRQSNYTSSSNQKIPQKQVTRNKISSKKVGEGNKSQIMNKGEKAQISPWRGSEVRIKDFNETKESLNATAPLSMLNKIKYEEAIVQGFSDAVNSSSNLKRMNSKESNKEQINFNQYYSGVLGPKTIVSQKPSVSPKKAAKKQFLIQSLLSQDANKHFLNLTLQHLIQQQRPQDLRRQRTAGSSYGEQPLNKTTTDQYMNIYQNYQVEHQPKIIKQRNQSQKNKFATTMKVQNLNNTFGEEERGVNNERKSMKTTQIIQDNEKNTTMRKTSAMSNYSNNRVENTITKQKKIFNNKNSELEKSKSKHRKQDSQDKDLMKRIMNFYQDDLHTTHEDKQSKTQSAAKISQGVYLSQTKHKGNSTLNSYLRNQWNNPAYNFETEQIIHPYIQQRPKRSNTMTKTEKIKEIQNKTQPIPKNILEMANAQVVTLSTGTSIMCNKAPSKDSIGKVQKCAMKEIAQEFKDDIKPKVGNRMEVEIAMRKEEVNATILDEEQEQPDEGKSKLDRYILGKQVGQGAYAIVRVATSKKDKKPFAIKIYDKSKLTDLNRQRSVRREIKLLQRMNHPNIVKIYEAFETEHHVYLVMEYVGGGSLHSYLKERANRRLEEEEAKRIFKQILTALAYCHKKCITHRDIKLENILLDQDKNVKLIDFGFSTCIPNDKKIKMFCGTPSYMAPEIVMKEEYAGPPADIWASAVLLYALLNGCFPFRGATDKELYRRIQKGEFILHNQCVSEQFVELLTKMLNVHADQRPTSEQVLDDEWFKTETHGSIADQKRYFKARMLGKVQVERSSKTICLNSSQEHIKNMQIGKRNITANGNCGNGNTSFGAINPNFQSNINNTNNNPAEFSDYGLHQSNAMRKLNQEAYQAYYNTSGGTNFQPNAQQNPYFNNFFQTNFIQTAPSGNFYPSFNNMRTSPSKTQQQPTIQTNFPFQQQQQQVPTPQVFASPTGAFHCNGGMINNNFNIINNITQVTCLSPPENAQQQQPNQNAGNEKFTNEFDEQIVSSITRMGYHRSHVVSQLENDNSHISQLYAKLKEEKMSQTQNRPLSLQPQRKVYQNLQEHNHVIYPNFIPSLPESFKGQEEENREENQIYYEQQEKIGLSPRVMKKPLISF